MYYSYLSTQVWKWTKWFGSEQSMRSNAWGRLNSISDLISNLIEKHKKTIRVFTIWIKYVQITTVKARASSVRSQIQPQYSTRWKLNLQRLNHCLTLPNRKRDLFYQFLHTKCRASPIRMIWNLSSLSSSLIWWNAEILALHTTAPHMKKEWSVA